MTNHYSLLKKYVTATLTGLILSFTALPLMGQTYIMVRTAEDGGVPFTSADDHSSWASATSDLQEAIDAVHTAGGGEVWVAGGTYLPTAWHTPFVDGTPEPDPPSDRSKSFLPRNGVAVIGGFSGTESSPDDRPADLFGGGNATILSGDIDNDGDPSENSFHVVYFLIGTDNTAVLSDLVIAHGNATPPTDNTSYNPFAQRGGGIHMHMGGVVENCHIRDNRAETDGGGIYIYEEGRLNGCSIYNNISDTDGGGVSLNQGGTVENSSVYLNQAGSDPAGKGGGIFMVSGGVVSHSYIVGNTSGNKGGGVGIEGGGNLINNLIANNATSGNGGGIHLHTGGVVLNNTVVANKADGGAGLYADEGGEIKNTVFWSNETNYIENLQIQIKNGDTHLDYCAIQNGTAADDITNLVVLAPENSGTGMHPEFINPVGFVGAPDAGQMAEIWAADYRTGLQSALINAGTPDVTSLPLTDTDLNGNPRITKALIDIGAYETLYYTVTSSVTGSSGGTVEPAGITNILPGSAHEFTLTPETGYQVESFTINSLERKDDLIPSNGSFSLTINNIEQDIEAIAGFSVVSAVNKPGNGPDIRIYPNPASNTLHITGESVSEATIFSLSGQMMLKLNNSDVKNRIDITSLPNGIYFINIVLQNGAKRVYKMIKK